MSPAPRTIRVVDYDPDWPLQFEELRRRLAGKLGVLAVTIEHVGSTAVPGLAAKPIIDLDVVIESRASLPAAVAALAELGYAHQGDLGIAGREAFKHADGSHHLYVCARDNPELARHVAFRDSLRADAGAAAEYGALKKRLALEHPHDIDAYLAGKHAFIEDALLRAD